MNKSIDFEIIKLKLESMDSFSIFKWLEDNKDDYRHIANNREIVSILYSINEELINIGLAMYSRGYTYNMYKNTNNYKEQLSYLSSEVNSFVVEKEDIISDLIGDYNEAKFLQNKKELLKIEDKLKAFFSNENIYEFRCILMNLYTKDREDIFKNIDNKLWLKLISYTANQNILSKYDETIDDTFAPAKCEYYLNAFWNLFKIIEITEENAKMLVEMVENNEAIKNNHSFSSTLEDIKRWESDEKNTDFLFTRYYLAKTNEEILSAESTDLAIRMAYYSSYKFVKELNKNLPDETQLERMYGYRENYDYYINKLKEYYSIDKNNFLQILVNNEYILLDNLLLEHAVADICSEGDILYGVMIRDRISEVESKYPHRFKKYEDLSEIDKLKDESEKIQYILEETQNLGSLTTSNFENLNKLSLLPSELRGDTNELKLLLMAIVVLEIINLFL